MLSQRYHPLPSSTDTLSPTHQSAKGWGLSSTHQSEGQGPVSPAHLPAEDGEATVFVDLRPTVRGGVRAELPTTSTVSSSAQHTMPEEEGWGWCVVHVLVEEGGAVCSGRGCVVRVLVEEGAAVCNGRGCVVHVLVEEGGLVCSGRGCVVRVLVEVGGAVCSGLGCVVRFLVKEGGAGKQWKRGVGLRYSGGG